MEYLLAVLSAAELVLLIILAVSRKKNDFSAEFESLRKSLNESTQTSVKNLGELLSSNQKQADEQMTRHLSDLDKGLTEKQAAMNQTVSESLKQMENRLKTTETTTDQRLESIRATIEKQMSAIREEHSKKLEEMRQTVDEKLQKSLEEKMNQSFRMVSERLEQVYKGLGEMQTLANGVGDLKRVLSNVKTRGILGEIQLGAILEEILSHEQYETNVATRPGSRAVVEYAVKIPTEEGGFLYLPIDAKFPADAYTQLLDAYDSGSAENVKQAASALCTRIRQFAKDIHDKYIEVPYTTEFAILFLPFEGLYAEVVNRSMVEILQRDYKVNIAGPSTMAALLNSLQMGFGSMMIQKRSAEVWSILESVKSEFDKFAKVLENTQTRLAQANKELDTLVGVRTRAIQRKLSQVKEPQLGSGKDTEESE